MTAPGRRDPSSRTRPTSGRTVAAIGLGAIAAALFGITAAAAGPAVAVLHPAVATPAVASTHEEPNEMAESGDSSGSIQQEAEAKPEKSRWRKIWGWVLIVAYALGILSAIDAIMSTRTEPGAIAWSISLVTAPVVAVPAYWVLGRSKFEGYVEAFEDKQEDFEALITHARKEMDPVTVEFETRTPGFDALRGLANMRLLRGNGAELLIDGEETFDSILEGIAAAEDYVLVQFFIVHDDDLGRRLKNAMIERARAGVMVAFLYDELGSTIGRGYRRDLREAGVKVSAFNTTKGWQNKFQLNFRNHRKIVVVDGRTTWIGGHNVGDEYLGHDPDMSPWRDTHVRLDGPIAIQAQGVFAMDWFWAQRELLELDWKPDPAPDGSDMPGIVVATGPADPLETAGMFFVHALNSARDRIWITAPYFVPDESIVKALMLASLRGVDVRILVPGIVDKWLADRAMYHYMELLADSNVKFYMHRPGFLHQKVMVVDEAIASIGTHNFDNRSFRLNFEISAVLYDEAFTTEVAKMLERDMATSELLDPTTFKDRSWFWRFSVNFARLWAPVL
ncbi:MAG: cardiolipin synthase [marine benthic group bacterium]|nr:cardiolipin synthase [Gemmatimonadota bacterium]